MKYYPSKLTGIIYSAIILIITVIFFLIRHFFDSTGALVMGCVSGIILILWNSPLFTRPIKWVEVGENGISVVFRRKQMSYSPSDSY